MPRRIDVDKLLRENRALRAENRKLKREEEKMRGRVQELAERVQALREKQAALAAGAGSTDDLLRWLKARMLAIERELES